MRLGSIPDVVRTLRNRETFELGASYIYPMAATARQGKDLRCFSPILASLRSTLLC